MITDVKPKQPIELPTQSPDDHILQQVRRRYARSSTPGLIERGLRGSSTAIAAGQGLSLEEQEAAEQYKEENPNWIRDGVETLINMTASLPVFGAGTVAGTAVAGPVGGAAGGFAVDTAVREVYQKYLESVKKGQTTLSFDDWMEVAKETGKSGALGGALAVASPFLKLATNNPVVGKLLKTPLSKAAADLAVEAGAFTVGGAAIGHGELTLEDFRDNLIAIGGMHLSQAAVKSLYKKHKETGKPPEQLLIEYKPQALETPITPEQKSQAERITKERAPKEKEPDLSLEQKFKRGLKEIAEQEQAGTKPVGFKTAKGSSYHINSDGSTTRNKAYRPEHGKKEQGVQERSQNTWYVDDAGLKKLGIFQTKGHGADLVLKRYGDKLLVEYANGPNKGKGLATSVSSFHLEPKKGLTPVEVWDNGKRVHFGNKITEVITKGKSELEKIRKKELAKEATRKVEELKRRHSELKVKAEEPTTRERYESEREMNKPLSQRLGEVLADKEANVKRLYSQLNKSMAAKEPRPVKELIRKQIREIESEIKELNEAKQKRQKATIEQSANTIKKKKGSKKYVEETNRAADQIAQDVLDKVERNSDRQVAYEAIKKDLEPMGIKLRCL